MNFSDLFLNKKTSIITLASIAIGFIIILIVIYFIGRSVGKAKALAEEYNQSSKDIDKKDLSYPISTYNQMADSIYNALLGYTSENDFLSIRSAFNKINTQSDLFQLIKSFGTRSSALLGYFTVFSGSLSEWLNEDLNTEQKNEIMSILESKNITFSI